MKDIALDANSDLDVAQNDLRFISDVQAIRQALYVLFSTNRGEWFLNLLMGLDQMKLVGKPRDEVIRSEVINTLSQEPTVQQINDIQIVQDRKNRVLYVAYEVITVNGNAVTGEVEINA